MRAAYIESSALFVRGGVYRVVKEAMGGFLAKLSVSALLFDFILTGPISGVSAGQYIVSLVLEILASFGDVSIDGGTRQAIKNWGSVLIACAITLYFLRQNLLGIPTSSSKALRIMVATTVMGVIMLTWSGVTLVIKGPVNPIPSAVPDLHKKVEVNETGDVPSINLLTGEKEDPLGFLGRFPALAEPLRDPEGWLSLVGIIGVIIAFGHSILAMSGEETLAQVYREVEAPKLTNFKKAAFLVFLYSLLLTGTMNFLALLLIPDDLRMTEYYDNWIGGLAMQMVGPLPARLLLNAFVVVVGFLILSGAVNTPIIGSNGVLNRVAEDGVLPDWFLKPHRRYGTASRILWIITGLQLFTIVVSRGRCDPARRSLRLRRRMELRVHDAVDGSSALQGPQHTGVQGAGKRADRRDGGACWTDPDILARVSLGGGESADQAGGDSQRISFHRGVSGHLSRDGPLLREAAARGEARTPRAVQPASGSGGHRGKPWPDQALPEVGRHSLVL